MGFLPIVERELREAARQPKTWWRRVWTLAAGLAVFGFVAMAFGRFNTASALGRNLFSALAIFGLFVSLLAGALTTADCLSRERRQGTLGLLFLTDLHSYDIVLGKLVAASLDMILGLIALLPLAALPFLMGGLGLKEFGLAALTVGNILFLSLAVGLWASASTSSARAVLGLTLGFLLFLSVGLPILVDGFGVGRSREQWLYLLCPSYTLHLALNVAPRRWAGGGLWYSLLAQHCLGWGLLWVACRRTARAWHEQGRQPALHGGWRRRLGKSRRSKTSRSRRFMLEHNPVAWLEGRDVLQERLLWGLCLAAVIFLAAKHLLTRSSWPNEDWVITWGMCSQYILCLWLGIQAPRRLAEDKDSGALELLLCTPTSPQEVVRGNLLALRRRFGRAMLLLVCLDAFLVHAYRAQHGGWSGLSYNGWDNFLTVALYGLIVFPIQGWSIARVGVYEGLVHAGRGSFFVLGKLGLLPWVLFITSLFAWDALARQFRFQGVNDSMAFGTWALVHLVCCLGFVLHANWHLRRNLRALAAAVHPRPWWKFWHRQLPAR